MTIHAHKRSVWPGERHDAELADRFTRIFHRNPSQEDVARVRRADARHKLRLQQRARRRLARLIAAP